MPVQHIALLQFKPGADVPRLFAELKRLTQVIPGITAFSYGENHSPEGLDRGLTHGFVMTFTDRAARDAYLVHPEHQTFVKFAVPLVEQIVVLDYGG
jgi:hypothetical protein